MRVLILGAGALGGLVGAQLTRAGEDVTLLEVNTARARLLAHDGLLISRMGEEEMCVRLKVVPSVEGLEPFDLVFVAVKTYETENAVRAALPACSDKTLFLSLQNGVGNAEKLCEIAGASRVLCGITYHSIQHAGPRRLQYRTGIKPIQIAPAEPRDANDPRLTEIATVFRRAGFDTEVVPDVGHAIWQKLLHNAVVNPTSALTGLTCREMLADPDLMAFMRSLCNEIVAVMRARGVPIVDEEDPFRPVTGSLKALGKNRPSMWQDLSRGKRTEVDALNGAVVAEAKRLGLTAPHNAAITSFIHSRERQTFLHREEITKQLGLGRTAAQTDGKPRSAPTVKRKKQAPAASRPLESTRKLKELVRSYYEDLARASEDPSRDVVACSSLAPVEIARAMGMVPWFPEHHAVLISAAGQSARCLARASAEGFSQFASSAMRCDVGALLSGDTPLPYLYGVPTVPRPSLALYSTNAGNELRRWFEFYGSHFGIPVVGFHPAPGRIAPSVADQFAATDQLLGIVEQLERCVEQRLDRDRLGEVVRASAEASALWERILLTARAHPAPLTFFDAIVHLAPMALLRGTEGAVEYYRLLLAELEDRVSSGIGALENEQHRFYWDGPPVWCASWPLAETFAEQGIAVVASTYAFEYALTDLDGDDAIPSLARAYTSVLPNQPDGSRMASLEGRFVDFGVDAAVYHDCRTSADASQVRSAMGARLMRLTAVPALVLEADAHDPRLFSTERLERQLADFIERQREQFADRLVAY